MNMLQSSLKFLMVAAALRSTSADLSPRKPFPRPILKMRLMVMIGLVWLAAGCHAPDENAAPEPRNPGVTAQEVILGSSLALKATPAFSAPRPFEVP